RSHTRQGQRSLVFCQAAPHRGCIHVSLELEDDLPQVFIDKIQIQLVLFNLVRNAMEALERSLRREIGIKTYAARTERSKSRSGTQAQASTRAWLISCLPSISRQRSMVWESGCRSASRLSTPTAAGCGRPIPLEVVRPFILLFQSLNQSMANNCKVLIVDDDKGVRASLAALLRTAVFEVETYGSGPEFLQAWTPERCGCVLIDVRMPGMSGLQLQTQLAEQGITLPVIVITGHADVPMAVAAMRAGAVDFIEKPFNDDTIISSVQRAFEIGIKLRDEGLSAAELKARIARLT